MPTKRNKRRKPHKTGKVPAHLAAARAIKAAKYKGRHHLTYPKACIIKQIEEDPRYKLPNNHPAYQDGVTLDPFAVASLIRETIAILLPTYSNKIAGRLNKIERICRMTMPLEQANPDIPPRRVDHTENPNDR